MKINTGFELVNDVNVPHIWLGICKKEGTQFCELGEHLTPCKLDCPYKNNVGKIVAVLSTTVLPLDGTYTVYRADNINIEGIPHYIGHPATKDIVESLGAIPSESKLFEGLKPRESAVCFSIKQGMSCRKEDGFTSPHQQITADMLDIRIITREYTDRWICNFCGRENIRGHFCSSCGAE